MSKIKEGIKAKLNRNTYDVNVEWYVSAEEVAHDCKNRKARYKDYDMMIKDNISNDWHGVGSYDEAIELMKLGYQPTVKKLQAALKANVTGVGKRIQFENNVHGFAPIVPLAMKGIPNSMVNVTMKPIKCKVIDVYYDMGVNGGAYADEIISAGQKLLGSIIELERQGYRFNLYAMQAYSDNNSSDVLCVKVKSSDKPIDLKRISFPLTHPAFFRVIGFDWQAKSPITRYRGSGRGCALTSMININDSKNFAKQVFGDNAVYLSCSSIVHEDEKHIKEALTA